MKKATRTKIKRSMTNLEKAYGELADIRNKFFLEDAALEGDQIHRMANALSIILLNLDHLLKHGFESELPYDIR